MDNLNTHQRYAFYEHLPPEEARQLFSKLEFHFTPEHGIWLNMAEIEFSALWTECRHKSIKDFLAWTTSRSTAVRVFYFGFAVILYDMWLLVDLLVQVSLDIDQRGGG